MTSNPSCLLFLGCLVTGNCAISKTQVVLSDTTAEQAADLQPDKYLLGCKNTGPDHSCKNTGPALPNALLLMYSNTNVLAEWHAHGNYAGASRSVPAAWAERGPRRGTSHSSQRSRCGRLRYVHVRHSHCFRSRQPPALHDAIANVDRTDKHNRCASPVAGIGYHENAIGSLRRMQLRAYQGPKLQDNGDAACCELVYAPGDKAIQTSSKVKRQEIEIYINRRSMLYCSKNCVWYGAHE